jgi:hypothetical protein
MSETKVLSRTSRYMARVSAHLPTLASDAERREFITEQLAKFEADYDAFIRKVDGGGDPGDITAFDFVRDNFALEALELARYSESEWCCNEHHAPNEIRAQHQHSALVRQMLMRLADGSATRGNAARRREASARRPRLDRSRSPRARIRREGGLTMTTITGPWKISDYESRIRDQRVVAQIISAMIRRCHDCMSDGTVMLVLQQEGFAGETLYRLWPLLQSTIDGIMATEVEKVS